MLKAIFFDAVGTLIHLPRGVGIPYAAVFRRHGLDLAPATIDATFGAAWKSMPARVTTRSPRPEDDKPWWRELVNRVLAGLSDAPTVDRDVLFEELYRHFAERGVWALYPDARPALEQLAGRYTLGVISNFDRRLHPVLRDLGIHSFFQTITLSSEVGADKPDPFIYERALQEAGVHAGEALHVGDDPRGDWEGAEAAGLAVFRLDRRSDSLATLASKLILP